MKNPDRRNWLVLAAELSGYTYDLFETVSTLGGVDVRLLCSPLVPQSSFQHEQAKRSSGSCLWWETAGWSEIANFVRDPPPDAIFVYGNRPRLKMAYALVLAPRSVPTFYAADTNIAALHPAGWKTYARRFASIQVAMRAKAALSLGGSNRQALQALGFPRIIDLPVYAVDFDALDLGAKRGSEQSEAHTGRLNLLIIARLVPEKNLPAFVSALAADPVLRKRVRLTIAGEGPDRPALESLKRRAPDLRVDLLGAVPRANIGSLFTLADALLLPSRFEPWGIVVVESLGMGLPVIASPVVGAAASLADATQAVVLARSADPQDMLAAIQTFLSRQPEFSSCAGAAMPDIRSRYGRQAVAQAHLELVYPMSRRTSS